MSKDLGPGGLTFEQLEQACKNIGYDLSCGGCASIFYTGTPATHTCGKGVSIGKVFGNAFKRLAVNAVADIESALKLIKRHGGTEGAHHKQWVLDQVVRILLGNQDDYNRWVEEYENGEDGPKTYSWDKGIAP
jgi:hypothetical protein